jgi:hypothetical protein
VDRTDEAAFCAANNVDILLMAGLVRSVALWASAFEILYPAKKEAYKGVYAALNSISWNNSACSTKSYKAYSDKSGALYTLLLTPFSRNSRDFVSEFPGRNTRCLVPAFAGAD